MNTSVGKGAKLIQLMKGLPNRKDDANIKRCHKI